MQTVIGLSATAGLLALLFFAYRGSRGVKPRKGSNSTSDAVNIISDRNIHSP